MRHREHPLLPLLLLIPLLLAPTACTSKPAAAVTDFYEALGEGRVDDAMQRLSSDVVEHLPRAKVRAGLESAARQIIDNGGIEKLEVTGEEITGDLGRVTVRLELGNGETRTETSEVVQENGEWKIRFEK